MAKTDIKISGRAFIVRPFGKKKNEAGEENDYDKVERELILPAIEQLEFSGGSTAEIMQQGNIRTDMFQELLLADLVIADISIHNANAFYELGIRHAFRDRYTVMIKANKNGDPHVFDLKADRYLAYDPEKPAESLETLLTTIRATLKNENGDSPVFKLLPRLEPIDFDAVIEVPRWFSEKVELCKGDPKTLNELDQELIDKSWQIGGYRLIGQAQMKSDNHKDAITTWNRIREYRMYDIEANQKLATSYQKTGQFVLSEQAISRALEQAGDWDKAETHALDGSNIKARWIQTWQEKKDIESRQHNALCSQLLQDAFNAYLKGFEHSRCHYYSGLNAVALLAAKIALAKQAPGQWVLMNDDNKRRAEFELEDLQLLLDKLTIAAQFAIESSVKNYPDDSWAAISKADLELITGNNPKKVTLEYQCCANDIAGFSASSLKQQLDLYRSLGLFEENVNAAYGVIKNA